MKNYKIVGAALLGLALSTLAACQSGGLSYQKGDKIFTKRILFDTSASEVINPSFKLKSDKKVSEAKLGRANLTFGVKKGVITFKGEEFKQAGAGEKTLTISYKDGSSEKVEALLANKFIYTADDFQSINEELTGIYVLAQDIDFSEMDNFEPLGRFATEEDPENDYFHGVLDGDGYSLKNLTCSYSDGETAPGNRSDSGYPSNYDVYSGDEKFEGETHIHGDNIGVFQFIGSSGVVRNLVFDNVKVHGRAIVGVVAGNLSGTAENLLIKSNCSVLMDTHFWDDDINCGGAFGIVAGGAVANNIVSLTKDVKIRGTFEDWGDQYVGESGAGYDHGYDASNPFWRYWGNNKVDSTQSVYTDSNGNVTNGVYSVVGKCWGTVNNSVGVAFKAGRFDQNSTEVSFGQTHLGINKPTSGDSNLGELNNCGVYNNENLKKAATYASFDLEAWNIADGSYPSLKKNVNSFEIAE